jgi:methylated-DNA-[protein]-cysteine S-methyltransferase
MRAWRQPSPYGEVTVVLTDDGVHEISLPGGEQPDIPVTEADRAVARQLDEWFAGRRHEFDLPLDLSEIDGFRRTVLETLVQEVPWGEVVSYSRGGRARRAPSAARCATTRSPS